MQNDSPNPANGSPGLLRRLGNAILMLFVTPVMLMNELRRELHKDVYSGWDGSARAVIGAFLGLLTAGAAGHYLGWVLEWQLAAWLSSGVAAWFATYWFIWPLLYLFPVRPIIKLAELAGSSFRVISRNYADRVFSTFISRFCGLLPGSKSAWNKVLEAKTRDGLAARAVLGLAYPLALAASASAGYLAYGSVSALLAGWTISPVIGLACAALVVFTLTSALWQFIEEGKLPFVATALGVGVERIFSHELNGIAAALHLSDSLSILLHASAILLYVAYLFPFFVLLLSGGFISWAIERLKPINDQAYDDRDRRYADFFRQSATLLATGLALFKSYGLALSLGLPVWSIGPALAVVGFFAYIWVYDVIDHGGGNLIVGIATSVALGWWTGSNYLRMDMPGGIWMAMPAGFFSFLLNTVLVFPGVYLVLKPLLISSGVSKLGIPMSQLHNRIEEGFRRLLRKLMEVYDMSYRDRSSYQQWFLHASNLLVASLLAWYLPSALAVAKPLVPNFAESLLVWSAAMIQIAQVLCWMLSYLLVGRIILKSDLGCELLGGLGSLALAVWLSSQTVSINASIWATIIAGLLGWVIGFCLVFPAAYILFRLPAKYLLASWSTQALVRIYDFAWSYFSVVWDKFLVIYKLLDRAIFVPIRNAIAAAGHRASDAYGKLRDKILKRK